MKGYRLQYMKGSVGLVVGWKRSYCNYRHGKERPELDER